MHNLQDHKWFGEDGRLLMEANPCFRPHSGARQIRDEHNECEVQFNNVSTARIHILYLHVCMICRLQMNMAQQIIPVR